MRQTSDQLQAALHSQGDATSSLADVQARLR